MKDTSMLTIAALLIAIAADTPKSDVPDAPAAAVTPTVTVDSPYQFTIIRDADDGLIVLVI